jgi:calcyphosin
MFFGSFETTKVKNELSFREFEEYYEGLSLSIDIDDDFINILQNCWSI